jgi:hypothetical protein
MANKKIQKYMGEHIDPMRIRLEKIKYQKGKRDLEREAKRPRPSLLLKGVTMASSFTQ